jgi:hypothetical protein
LIPTHGGLIARLLAVFGNHRRGNTRGLGRAKAGKAILNHQTLAGRRLSLRNVVRYTAGCGLPRGSSSALEITSKMPERELVQHRGNNLAG